MKITNELVINGYVYDEMKAFLEFDHKLSAKVGDHTVLAGLEDEFSYIKFDGRTVKKKQRLI